MANQDVDTLARKIVSLERRHAALARAQQLPSSSVRLAEGEDVMLPSAIQNGEDAYSETGIIGERADNMGDLIDSEVEYGTYIPDWIEGSAHTGDYAWDSSQIAIDKASEVETIVEELTNVPKAPTGLTELSNVGAFTSVGARAEVGVSWTEVVTSVKDEPIGVDVYRVYVDGALRVEETHPPTSISIPSGISAEIRVTAVAEGLESDLSEALNITGALPSVANLAPTKPVLSTSHGNVRAVWDGLYTTPTLLGAHTVRVEARVGAGAWVVQGSALTGAGEQLVSVGEIGQSVQVRFRAFDQLGRLTGTSAVETITVAGIERADLEQEIQNALDDLDNYSEAIELAGGKLTLLDRAPVAADGVGKPVGALWMRRTGSGFTHLYEWTGDAWSARALDETIIPKVAIGEGTYGELEGDRLKAKTVLARHMIVADSENLIPWDPENGSDPHRSVWSADEVHTLNHPDYGWGIEYIGNHVIADGGQNTNLELRPAKPSRRGSANRHDIEPGTTYRFRMGVAFTTPPPEGYNRLRLRIQAYDITGTSLGTTFSDDFEWGPGLTYQSMLWTAPEGAVEARIGTYKNFWSSGNFFVSTPTFTRATDSSLLVDGAVKARTMDADEIYADEAHMNVLSAGLAQFDEITGLGNKLNITANESIELAVGRQNATDEQLSELREDVDGTIDAATHAATVADEASIAALAAGADLVAQNSRLEAVESGLSDQQAHFKILPNGVQVAFDDQSASLDMTPQSIRFMSQGTAVAEISQEAIIIHKGIFEQAQIGNHLMQKKGNRTTFTPIEGS